MRVTLLKLRGFLRGPLGQINVTSYLATVSLKCQLRSESVDSAWVAQSFKGLTIGFGSGGDLCGEIQPSIEAWAQCRVCLRLAVPLPLPLPAINKSILYFKKRSESEC